MLKNRVLTSLKKRVKKLEKKGGSRTQKLKRLYKEDASKQERKIDDIDADEDITLKNVHDAEMFDVNDLHGDEVFVVEEVVSAAEETVTFTDEEERSNQAKIKTDYELAQRLQEKEQEELTVDEKATLFQQLLEKRRKHFTAKRAEEKRNRPPTRA
ncbi:hypothetical protein Tco_0777131 [Tanacetum coccineum]